AKAEAQVRRRSTTAVVARFCIRAESLLLLPSTLLPSTFYLLPSTFYLLPTAFYSLPSTYCLLPTTFYPLPSASPIRSRHFAVAEDHGLAGEALVGDEVALRGDARLDRCRRAEVLHAADDSHATARADADTAAGVSERH